MREKILSLIITFDTTAQAMAAEKYCLEHQLPGRLIPVPREISAGCGLAWKASPGDQNRLISELDAAGIRWTASHLIEV
jgi:hypothetical protein